MYIYNCHIHTFMDVDVPRAFLPLGLVRILSTKPGFNIVSKVLNNINPFSDKDTFNRYVKFVETSKKGSQEKIFEYCKEFYPDGTKFIVISMDMKEMGAGKVPREYYKQLEELANLKKSNPEIIPFVHIEPRREKYFDIFKKCIEEWGFEGVKIYPSIGYFPYDERLYSVYEYCEKNDLPVMAHCSPNNPVYFKGSNKELEKLLSRSRTPLDLKGRKRKERTALFTYPKNWNYVINDFKNLRLCLSHFGSSDAWKEYIEEPQKKDNWFVAIKKMMEDNNNIYADISFTLSKREYFPLLKVLLEDPKLSSKILFGTDYYMVETKVTERHFGLDLRAYIGKDKFKTIAQDNPRSFLKKIN